MVADADVRLVFAGDAMEMHNERPRRILVVEDDYFVAADLTEGLKRRGLAVVGPVGMADDALRLVASEAVDFAILDVNLDGTMVFPVAAALRDANIPFVFATGYDQDIIPDRFRNVPLHAKPLHTETLCVLAAKTAADRLAHQTRPAGSDGNALWRLLPSEDIAALLPHAVRRGPVPGEISDMRGCVLFPEHGFCSLSLADGAGVTVAVVGREGLIGGPLTDYGEQFRLVARWQRGSEYTALPADAVMSVLARSSRFQRMAAQCRRSFIAQIAWTSEAHATLTVTKNLARWILMARDRIGDLILVTHEELSHALGVRRAGVTTALHVLEGERWIKSTRGRIIVRDPTGLESLLAQPHDRETCHPDRQIAFLHSSIGSLN